MALTSFLRYAESGGFVQTSDGPSVAPLRWGVTGTTPAASRSLAALEHLFMGLRSAAARYDSTLMMLDLVPTGSDAAAGWCVRVEGGGR